MNLMMAAIFNCVILNLAILDSAILVFPLKRTHTCQDWFPPFAQKKLHSHFPPHHLNKKTSLIHSDSTWWWWPSWIWPSWILPSWIQFLHHGIQTPCIFLPDLLKNTCHPLWFWLKLIQSDSNSFILTQLDDGGHHEMCNHEFCHLGFSFCHVGIRHLVLTPADSLKNTLPPLWFWFKLIQTDSNSFILTQLYDGSLFEFCHLEFHQLGFSHVRFRHLVIFSQIHSKTLSLHSDSDSN